MLDPQPPAAVPEGPLPRLMAVSCPGGLAVQYRVQVPLEGGLPIWRLVASFRDAAAAQRYARGLVAAGQSVRIVAWRCLPAAL
jgi:hypothetical protein